MIWIVIILNAFLWERNDIFTILILPIHERGIAFHLFRSLSFNEVSKFGSIKFVYIVSFRNYTCKLFIACVQKRNSLLYYDLISNTLLNTIILIICWFSLWTITLTLISFFPILPFFFPPCFTIMIRAYNTMMNINGDSEDPYVPDFRRECF